MELDSQLSNADWIKAGKPLDTVEAINDRKQKAIVSRREKILKKRREQQALKKNTR